MLRVPPTKMVVRLVRSAIAVLVLGAAYGCTRSARSGEAPGAVPRASGETLLVRNHYGDDVRVYVALDDGRKGIRLGIVPRLGTATFVLPRGIHVPNALQLVAIPLGHGEPQVMSLVIVEPGERFVLTIEHGAALSTLTRLP